MDNIYKHTFFRININYTNFRLLQFAVILSKKYLQVTQL